MSLNRHLTLLLAVLAGILLAACGGGSEPAPAGGGAPAAPAEFRILPDAEAAPYLEIIGPLGTKPCGVFDVGGQGAKSVKAGDFPGCAGRPIGGVACLNASAQWTTDTVSGLAISGQTIEFTSAQEGLCAIFPAP